MTTYYVTHPNLGFSATVEAPSTEKARTAFLDYLERQDRVPRSRRQDLRRNMVADRIMDAGEVMADVNLAYGYSEVSPSQSSLQERITIVGSGGPSGIAREFAEADRSGLEVAEESEQQAFPEIRQELDNLVEEEKYVPQETKLVSPIQQVSLGRRGRQ